MKIVVYGRDNCPSCVGAKEYLADRGMPFEYVDIQKYTEAAKYLFHALDVKTVPAILIDGEYIGGFNQLKELL